MHTLYFKMNAYAKCKHGAKLVKLKVTTKALKGYSQYKYCKSILLDHSLESFTVRVYISCQMVLVAVTG